MNECSLCGRPIKDGEPIVANNNFKHGVYFEWHIAHRRCYNHFTQKSTKNSFEVQVIIRAVEQELFLISRRRYG